MQLCKCESMHILKNTRMEVESALVYKYAIIWPCMLLPYENTTMRVCKYASIKVWINVSKYVGLHKLKYQC